MKKKKKDAKGSPHNMNNFKNRGAKGKMKDKSSTKKADAAISHRTPNDFNRSGNDADREMDMMRGMDREKQMGHKKYGKRPART